MRRNGIRHTTIAPYHPSSNEAAERAVGLVKKALERSSNAQGLDNYLMAYRNTCQSTTGRTPFELMMGRSMHTRLDLLRPNLEANVHAKQEKMTLRQGATRNMLEKKEPVLIRNYRQNAPKWTSGEVEKQLGKKHYLVGTELGTEKRHIDQILRS